LPAPVRTILILGGTREAAELARRLTALPDCRVISSLAGRTAAPALPAGETRIGGFGGANGMAAFMIAEGIDLLIDATHPFAERISKNAALAASETGTRLLRLARPPWRPQAGDRWRSVASLEAAATELPASARAFLALGSQHLSAFAPRRDVAFILRMVDPPVEPPLPGAKIVLGKPSRDPAEEAALFRGHGVTHLVCRNSGGEGAIAKLAAARMLALPVIMVERAPPPAGGEVFETTDTLLAAIA
jgi:precorrin-6A/cobalt-precorrin-6A reductase